MDTLNSILVIAEGPAPASAALERAADLALKTGAPLHLCLFGHDGPHGALAPDARERAHIEFRRSQQDWLSRHATALAARGISATAEFVDTAAPERALVAKALQFQPDLVIKDLHPESEYEWLAFSPEEDKLRHLCPAPLLLARAGSTRLPLRILAAVDTGRGERPADPVNESIVETALALGRAIDADVHLAHVFPRKALGGDAYQILRDAESEARAPERACFERFAQRYGFGADRYHWVEGRPGDALTGVTADLGAELVVIGSAYHSRLAEFFIDLLGSTGEAVVGGTHCDVMFVKPPGFVSDLARRLDLDAVCREYGVSYRQAA